MKDYEQLPNRPWLQVATITWIEALLQREWTILETGSGGSTVFFAQRVKWVISFESVYHWYAKTQRELARTQLQNVDWRFEPLYPKRGLVNISNINFALIDGRGRVVTGRDAWRCLLPGSWLVLDDSQRLQYQEIVNEFDLIAAEKTQWNSGTDQTTAWKK